MKKLYCMASRWAGRYGVAGIAALLLWLPGHAWAQGKERDCTFIGNALQTIALPATINVPRDLPVGAILLKPVMGPATDLYRCTNAISDNASGVITRGSGLGLPGMTASNVVLGAQTISARVYETNVSGVGIVIAVKGSNTGCPPDIWWDLYLGPDWGTSLCNGVGTVLDGLQVAIGLVKTKAVVTPGLVTGKSVIEFAERVRSTTRVVTESSAQRGFVAFTSVRILESSCSTPNVTVPMGSHAQSAFKGIGSLSSPVPFSVAINNCPAGLSRINLQLLAPSGYVDQNAGIIKLTDDSTARGIGLKLTQAVGGAAMKFGAPGYNVPNYDPKIGGTFAMAFNAAYYQAAQSVSGGSANAVLEFTMSYQ